MAKERIIQLRAAINEQVFLHERLGDYIQRLVAATRPYNPDTDWLIHSPSELVEHGVDLGASPRAIICWGRLAKVWALLVRRRDEVYPGRHPGSRAVRPQPPHLARPARRQPRPDRRRGDQGHHRAGGDSLMKILSSPTRRPGEDAARQPLGDHRGRAAHPEADARVHDRRAPQPVSRHGLRLRRPARLAGGRPLRVDRLGAVVAHQLQPADRPRVRAADHGQRRSSWPTGRCPRAAASTACRSRQPIARAIATIGMSAVFFQDLFGLITFDDAASDASRRRSGRASARAR